MCRIKLRQLVLALQLVCAAEYYGKDALVEGVVDGVISEMKKGQCVCVFVSWGQVSW